jgi:hypothetical protein
MAPVIDGVGMSDDRPGYTDTPYLPDSEYRVHDATRPHPPVVDPGDGSDGPPDPPSDATVLMDGSGLEEWEGLDGGDAGWNAEGDYVETEPDAGDIQTVDPIGDCQLHVEWAAPSEVSGDGQGRGNSGVFLMDRYEIQVLDCYDNPTYADGHAGAVYGQHPPLVNACRPPGAWQSFDVVWRGPRFDGDELARPARVTVLHNGVVVQDSAELVGPTTHGEVLEYEPHPQSAPLRLQDHGDRVRFRNVWYRPLDEE